MLQVVFNVFYSHCQIVGFWPSKFLLFQFIGFLEPYMDDGHLKGWKYWLDSEDVCTGFHDLQGIPFHLITTLLCEAFGFTNVNHWLYVPVLTTTNECKRTHVSSLFCNLLITCIIHMVFNLLFLSIHFLFPSCFISILFLFFPEKRVILFTFEDLFIKS